MDFLKSRDNRSYVFNTVIKQDNMLNDLCLLLHYYLAYGYNESVDEYDRVMRVDLVVVFRVGECVSGGARRRAAVGSSLPAISGSTHANNPRARAARTATRART